MDGAGKLYVVWNDCRYESGCMANDLLMTLSTNGTTWSTPAQLAGPMSVTWFVNTQWGYTPGDYITTSFAGGKAFPVFSVASAPNGTTYNQPTDTVANGLLR